MRRLGILFGLAAVAFYAVWPAYSGYQIRSALEAKDPAALEMKVDFPSVRESLRPVVAAKVEDNLKELLKSAGPSGAALLEKMRERVLPQVVDGTLTKFVTAENIIKMHSEGRNFKDMLDKLAKDEAGKTGGGLGGIPGAGGAGQPGTGASGTLDKLKDLAGKAGIDPGKLGGLFGKKPDAGAASPDPASPAPPAPAPTVSDAAARDGAGDRPKYGLGNIKSVGLNGPLGFNVGVAKDAAAKDADLTAGMSFTGGDWKLTSIVPRL